MLKAAIEKIESMAKPAIEKIGSDTFIIGKDGDYTQIEKQIDSPCLIILKSLEAMVKMVQVEASKNYKAPYFIEVESPTEVTCFLMADPDKRWNRTSLYCSKETCVPGWRETENMKFETAAVALQTRFQDSPDRQYTLQLLSQITMGAKVTYNDTGIATSIVTQKGISLQQNSTIKPIVKLKPYRTFQEVEQPEGLFLIRVDERGITFTEADGGMWKLQARKIIKAYLEENLKEMVEDGRVVIML